MKRTVGFRKKQRVPTTNRRILPGGLPHVILQTIASGAILATLLVAPGAALFLKPIIEKHGKSEHEAERRRIEKAMRRLREQRLVELDMRDGKEYLVVTGYGKRVLKQFELDAMALPKQNTWDKKWRVVMFDIPEGQKKNRRVFQAKLVELGFFPLQKSVLVYPYACRDEVDFLAEFFSVRRHCIYCETSDLGDHEIAARKYFRLL